MQPVVSVVIPVYNGARMIEACLASVCAQNADMEIIVVDDGSTDDTWAVLTRLAEGDRRIRPIRQANGGVSAARNCGLEACRGEYIRFVDADDVLPEGSMAALLDKARDNRSDLVIAGYREVVGPARTPRHLRPCGDTFATNDMLEHLNPRSNSFFYGVLWNKLFRRDIIMEHGVRFIGGLNWGEDFAFVCGYLTHAERVSYSPELVYDYLRNPGGMTVKQFVDCIRRPLHNCRIKLLLYRRLKALYVRRGVYPRYRATLWLYLIRVTLNN